MAKLKEYEDKAYTPIPGTATGTTRNTLRDARYDNYSAAGQARAKAISTLLPQMIKNPQIQQQVLSQADPKTLLDMYRRLNSFKDDSTHLKQYGVTPANAPIVDKLRQDVENKFAASFNTTTMDDRKFHTFMDYLNDPGILPESKRSLIEQIPNPGKAALWSMLDKRKKQRLADAESVGKPNFLSKLESGDNTASSMLLKRILYMRGGNQNELNRFYGNINHPDLMGMSPNEKIPKAFQPTFDQLTKDLSAIGFNKPSLGTVQSLSKVLSNPKILKQLAARKLYLEQSPEARRASAERYRGIPGAEFTTPFDRSMYDIPTAEANPRVNNLYTKYLRPQPPPTTTNLYRTR